MTTPVFRRIFFSEINNDLFKTSCRCRRIESFCNSMLTWFGYRRIGRRCSARKPLTGAAEFGVAALRPAGEPCNTVPVVTAATIASAGTALATAATMRLCPATERLVHLHWCHLSEI
ncbi:hypothetical protein [Mycobacterium sp. 852002-51163_SCH5372311]|uniref:hypothetical protein n=1 Tax=Mycobacterium sp. 852002-51163_SCH5372311 TaxID=1834097 RepID=UPI000A69D767|nr:hypothetical protein [Mycobacterium sp. 852002-51163_SCH5372311]